MSLITDAVAGAARTTTAATGAMAEASSSDFDMFLKMLTAQIRNQDPLEPMDSADYAAQLATFSGVEQQVKTNDLLAALTASMTQGGLSQVASWVGREVRAPVAAGFDGAPVTLALETQAGSDAGALIVTDASGMEVERRDIAAGARELAWGDDSRPHGLYRFEVASLFEGEEIGREIVETYGRVREVRLGPEGPELLLEGGVAVAAGSVTALREAA